MSSDRPILICDVANIFIRNYAAFPSMSHNGHQMGGCVGTLKMLRRLVQELQPKQIFMIWESGGSQKRRAIYSEYKLGRRPAKLNRFYEDDIPESEDNIQQQQVALLKLLNALPVCQIYVSDCEGDDVIAYLCSKFKQENKIIVSSDKDFYQLLDNKTQIYSPHKKKCVTSADVFEEYRITANNFAIAKALCGDPSDNIPGVKGLGFKTASKLYEILGLEQDVILQDVIDYSYSHKDESKFYKRVIDNLDDVKRNYRLIHLGSSTLSPSQAAKVDNQLSTFKPRVNKMLFVKLLIKESLHDFDYESFFYAFNSIENITQAHE